MTHRNAAAFVDAEAQIFLQDNPLGPGDRVLAGLSVAFDASCEEMWLAWRHGACLVPAPRSLVRSGMDLGPWLVVAGHHGGLDGADARRAVARRGAGGGAAADLRRRGVPAGPGRAARRRGPRGVEHLRPHRGHRGRVPGQAGRRRGRSASACRCPAGISPSSTRTATRSPLGEVGELVIGGVGLARYLDPDKDAEKYAPMPTLGWSRAYRSGDLVRLEADGLYFQGRADDQVKVGGRRIELGEVDSALVNLPGVSGGAAAVRRTASGTPLLVGYVASADPEFDLTAARAAPGRVAARRAGAAPGAASTSCRPARRARSTATRCRGRSTAARRRRIPTSAARRAGWPGCGATCSAAPVDGPEADFFALGGGSLSAAQLVAALRARYPQVTVADLYDHPRLGSLAGYLDELDPPPQVETRSVKPVSRLDRAGAGGGVGAAGHADGHAVGGVAGAAQQRRRRRCTWCRGHVPVNWWWVLAGFLVFVTPLGRMAHRGARRPHPGRRRSSRAPTAAAARVHLRVWLAERLGEASGAENQAGAPWLVYYARALGNKVGKGVDLHSAPPVTGMLTLGHRCSIEPEVDLTGPLDRRRPLPRRSDHRRQRRHDRRANDAAARRHHRQERRRRAGFRRRRQGQGGPVLEGLARGEVGQGPPPVARRAAPPRPVLGGGLRRHVGPARRGAAGGARRRTCLAGLGDSRHAVTCGTRWSPSPSWTPVATIVAVVVYAALTVIGVRTLALGLREGYHPVRSRVGWQLWATERLMDAARNYLFPDLREPAHAVVAAAARREGRQGHRDLDGAADAEVHRRRGRRLPRRRHDGGVLRARRRLDPRRQGHHRQAGLPRQLGHHPAGPTGARRRAGGGAQRHAAQGQGGLVVAGQPADPAAPPADGRRRRCARSTRRCD